MKRRHYKCVTWLNTRIVENFVARPRSSSRRLLGQGWDPPDLLGETGVWPLVFYLLGITAQVSERILRPSIISLLFIISSSLSYIQISFLEAIYEAIIFPKCHSLCHASLHTCIHTVERRDNWISATDRRCASSQSLSSLFSRHGFCSAIVIRTQGLVLTERTTYHEARNTPFSHSVQTKKLKNKV